MNAPVKLGIVGCGSMGANHARVASGMSEIALVGVVDARPENREAVSRATGTPGFGTVAALAAAGIEAAVVAVPTAVHAAVASELMEAGIHVLVEKPIAATVADARTLVALAEARGLSLMVGHVERFNPALEALRKAVEPAAIRSIAIRRAGPFPARIGDVGIVLDLGVHDIDLIRWISSSEIAEQHAMVSKTIGAHEDCALMQFRTESGVLGAIETNWLTPFRQRRMEVATADAFYVCDMLLRTVTAYSDYGADGSCRQRSLFVGTTEPLKAELLAFAAAVRGRAPVAVTGHDGLRSLEIALACLG